VKFTNQRPFAGELRPAEVVDQSTGKIEGQLKVGDLDGDPAKFTLATTDPASPESSTPGTLDFDLATGEYTFTPKPSVRVARAGQYLVLNYTVEDDYSLTNSSIAVLYIAPLPVVVVNPPTLPPTIPPTEPPIKPPTEILM
jgi:hypothetical protein